MTVQNQTYDRGNPIEPITNRLLGAHTFGFLWQTDVATAVEDLAEEGFRRFQLLALPPHLDVWNPSSTAIKRLEAAVRSSNGEILAIDLPSSETNLASASGQTVDFAVSAYAAVIEVAATLRARWVTINSGRRHALSAPPDGRLVDIFGGALIALLIWGRCGMSAY
jgi:deoxyribonuclease-4